MQRCLTLVLLVALTLPFAAAQRLMIVRKAYSRLSYHYKEGEKVKLRLQDSGEVLRGSWWYAGEDTIIVDGQRFPLKAIRWIDVTGKERGVWMLRRGRDLLTLAGAGYYAASGFNYLLEGGDSGGDRPVLRTSAGLLTGGILCGVLDRVVRKRKLTARRGLRIRVQELP